MNALDGNAIAGTLYDLVGAEMTDASGTCVSCGATTPLAEVTVYLGGPGTVARCRHCEHVLIVVVEIRGISCVDTSGLAAVRHPDRPVDRPRN